MALLMYAAVGGDREQWFLGLVWAQKVEQLNAALSLPLRLLHIQKATHFFLPSPLPDTSLRFLEEGVRFLGEEMGTIINFSLTADWFIEEIPIGQEVEGLGNWDKTSQKKATAAL